MNSEELEASLRTEFENYLKDVSAEMRREISGLQDRIESEIERHKSELSGIFAGVSARAAGDREISAGFKESVVEHLRLARDEGARITATAIAEAEEMDKEAVPPAGIKEILEAVNDISGKDSQAEILKSLVSHASLFAPRGAFFIIKNEYLVGWRMFGTEETVGDETVREVFLSTDSESVLSEAVRSLAAVESAHGTYSGDDAFLKRLEFGEPERMYAIPLVARGRGVAVLYADNGTGGASVNVEALETLVRVAGLTVEVLAAGKTASRKESAKPAPVAAGEGFSSAAFAKEAVQPQFEQSDSYNGINAVPVADTAFEESSGENSFDEPSYGSENFMTPAYEAEDSAQLDSSPVYEAAEISEEAPSAGTVGNYPVYEDSWNQPAPEAALTDLSVQEFMPDIGRENEPGEYVQNYAYQAADESKPVADDRSTGQSAADFSPGQPSDSEFVISSFEGAGSGYAPHAEVGAPIQEQSYASFEVENNQPQNSSAAFEPASQTIQPTASAPAQSRLSERNVDLPIDVAEEERRLHNDARRFARLLVSEIKLYNEQKVREGLDSNDLYDRLREAIDRSREMYDKRVQPAVAAKFDYFHYELVNTLAEGDDSKLGAGYPGTTV